ncbi:MAG: hypothetical protein ACLFQR_10080 [Desulfovibrionales bacterium]
MRKLMQILILCLFAVTLGVAGCEEPEVEDLTPTRVAPDGNATEGNQTYEEQPGVVQ